MNKTVRVVFFVISLIVIGLIVILMRPHLSPLGEPSTVLIVSLVMLSFVTMLLEHFFTRPADVIASSIAILLMLAPLHGALRNMGGWYTAIMCYCVAVLFASLVALLLVDGNASQEATKNRIAAQFKKFAVYFGNGRFLWFVTFVLTLLFYVDSQSQLFLILFAFSVFILLINPQKILYKFTWAAKLAHQELGTIFGVQSDNIFLAKLFDNSPDVKRFEYVAFRYSQDPVQRPRCGIVIDSYLLNEARWLRILSDDAIQASPPFDHAVKTKVRNAVYKLTDKGATDILERLVGTICEDSNIEKIRFSYAFKVDVGEGSLVEVKIVDKTILYQITEGITDTEPLESKNEAGLIVGEAMQLGTWNSSNHSFDKSGWVPKMNAAVMLSKGTEVLRPDRNEYEIGQIPNTNYPVLINLDEAIAHHLAVLGVTGSGKSIFVRNLIRQYVLRATKVICVDFTNEYGKTLRDINLQPIVTKDTSDKLFDAIEGLTNELDKFPNQRNKDAMSRYEKTLHDTFEDVIKTFLTSAQNAAVFELPDVTNTTGILEYTKWFFRVLFEIARTKNNYDHRVCVVLEEAHTIIPEWNFIGAEDKRASSLVNSIGQIALQGRKYGIGFVVVAQRTANVSKTVLTQCNTVIAFQQFDKTSGEFLSNYMGQAFVAALPRLKPRQAIAVGKAFKSGVPVIFQVPEITEPDAVEKQDIALGEAPEQRRTSKDE